MIIYNNNNVPKASLPYVVPRVCSSISCNMSSKKNEKSQYPDTSKKKTKSSSTPLYQCCQDQISLSYGAPSEIQNSLILDVDHSYVQLIHGTSPHYIFLGFFYPQCHIDTVPHGTLLHYLYMAVNTNHFCPTDFHTHPNTK